MFLVSGPELVIAACRAGVLGTFPALNQRSSEGFEAWLAEIRETLDPLGEDAAPFGVNLIVHRSNPRLQDDLELCVRHRVPVIITSLGAVADLVEAVHGYGGVVFHDVVNLRHARKAADAGVDGLIAVSAGAGGHAGSMSPFALVSEIRQFFDKTVLLAGSMGEGRHVAAARALGADLAYLGTRFIATRESRASEDYKQMIVASRAGDIVYTDAVSGVPANFLGASLQGNGYDLEELASRGLGQGQLKPIGDEVKAWKTIWSAGQGVGGIEDIPTVGDLVARIDAEYRAALADLADES
jgi:nitronate monooxygenase